MVQSFNTNGKHAKGKTIGMQNINKDTIKASGCYATWKVLIRMPDALEEKR